MSEFPKEIEVELLGRKVVLKQCARNEREYSSEDRPLLVAAYPREGPCAWELTVCAITAIGVVCVFDGAVTVTANTPQEAAAKLEAMVREHFTDPAMVFGFKEGSDGR